MKIIRYLDPTGEVRYAALQGDGAAVEIEGDVFGQYTVTARPARVAKLLAPVVPPAIYCIGLNYRQHAAESKLPIPEFPVVFMKAPTAVQNPEDPIWLPRHLRSDQVDYEAELAVVIGKKGKNIPREEALQYVQGYTCANDVSARDWQGRWGGTQWCRGKTFDTFCPLGPCLVSPEEIPDPNNLTLRLEINGEVLQDWHTGDMIFDVARLIEFLSGSTTLLPGTVILTGTPHGVGFARQPPRWLRPGDRCSITIPQIGTLTNPVEEEPLS
jgi:2-keto-4-pentenoate hydratase/2-oxohepta-3-ene-1,7-dioic acid hydratase in catechol pathway